MALYIFSDAHLGSGPPDLETLKVKRIAELFDRVKNDGDRLVILGDLFDFWFEYKHAIPKDHHEILFMLRDLGKTGIQIDYISGNHDFWMGDYFETQIGLTVYRDSLDIEYADRKVHLIHGDGLAAADRGYRILKKVLRNPFYIWLYRKLPPDWAIPFAKKVSGTSRDHTSKRDYGFAADYESYAQAKVSGGYDIVAIGHLHIPVLKKFDRGIYVNTGDFITHFSYARLDESGLTLEYLQ